MARVNTPEIAEKTGLPAEEVEKVVSQIIADKNNHKRQPRLPAPEGGISLSEAERKYGIPNQTFSRWAKKGYIPVLLCTKKELYVDEAKLVEVLNLYKESPGQGKKTIRQKLNAS